MSHDWAHARANPLIEERRARYESLRNQLNLLLGKASLPIAMLERWPRNSGSAAVLMQNRLIPAIRKSRKATAEDALLFAAVTSNGTMSLDDALAAVSVSMWSHPEIEAVLDAASMGFTGLSAAADQGRVRRLQNDLSQLWTDIGSGWGNTPKVDAPTPTPATSVLLAFQSLPQLPMGMRSVVPDTRECEEWQKRLNEGERIQAVACGLRRQKGMAVVVTDQRFLGISRLISTRISDIPLRNITSVTVRGSDLADYATLDVRWAGGEFKMGNVQPKPNAQVVKDAIESSRETARQTATTPRRPVARGRISSQVEDDPREAQAVRAWELTTKGLWASLAAILFSPVVAVMVGMFQGFMAGLATGIVFLATSLTIFRMFRHAQANAVSYRPIRLLPVRVIAAVGIGAVAFLAVLQWTAPSETPPTSPLPTSSVTTGPSTFGSTPDRVDDSSVLAGLQATWSGLTVSEKKQVCTLFTASPEATWQQFNAGASGGFTRSQFDAFMDQNC